MSDPATATAKAAEEAAKTGGKALEIVHDTGGYLARVFGDLPADVVGLAGDWVHERRIQLRDKWSRRTQQILRERDVQEVIELSPNVAAALVSGAQEEGRDELMELWARLLANAMDPNMNSVRNSFIEAVKTMDPMDAVMLNLMHTNGYRRVGIETKTDEIARHSLVSQLQTTDDDAIISLDHLDSLGLLDKYDSGFWRETSLGRAFLRACYPELSARDP